MRNREAQALARLLEGSAPAGEGSDELRALSQLAKALEAPAARPDDAFKAELRGMLVEQARELRAAPRILTRVRTRMASTAERVRYSTRVAAASLAAAMTFSGAGAVAVAAERALPSDALYGVKLAIDDARVAVRFDEVRRGELHLDNAAERIDEAEISAAREDNAGAARALHKSADSARRGASEMIKGYQARGDKSIVLALNTFAQVQGSRVRLLAERLDGEAHRAARSSLIVLERIEARLVAISGVCGDCPAAAPPDGDAFDFAEIPPADEPFQPCPCDEGGSEPAPRRASGDEDADQPGGAAPEPGGDDGDDGGHGGDSDDPAIDGLPEPVGGIVNEVLKPIVTKSAEKGPGGMPSAPQAPAAPSGGLGVPGGLLP